MEREERRTKEEGERKEDERKEGKRWRGRKEGDHKERNSRMEKDTWWNQAARICKVPSKLLALLMTWHLGNIFLLRGRRIRKEKEEKEEEKEKKR